MRQSSLAKVGDIDAVSISIDREIASRYDDVKIVADNIDDVIIVANAAATTAVVASNIDAITAIGSSIADIVAVNSNIVDVTSIADNIVDVSTVATNIGNINSVVTTVVPNMAEILLADDKAATATNMAVTATTQAGLANTARVAAEAAQVIAATKATEAGASAAAADLSADLAAASEAVATTKANAASASASAAHNSELAAAAMLDAFNDIYLGSFVVDPVTDNDGQPLLDGALYFNTSVNVLKVYDVGTTTWYTIPQTLLSSLLDVQLTSTTVGDILSWNGTKWVNTSSVQEHITDMNNPHSVTKAQVGLGNVDNTSDVTKNVLSATKLTTPRAIALTGDVTGTVNFDGSAGVSMTTAVGDNTHSHGDSTITDVAWSKISGKPDPVVTVTLTGDVTGTANTTLTDLGNGTVSVATVVGDDSHLHAFANLTSKPTTLSGYGITDTYGTTTQDWRGSMMSKAQFNALASERRVNRAGSGFDEFGKHYSVVASYPNVNEGLWTGSSSTYANKIVLGMKTSTAGLSKTNMPISLVNGNIHNIDGLYISDTNSNWILLPPAPTVLPYNATLTPEQIASGVIKHADASNSGLIVNGKFDVDTSGWTVLGAGTTFVSNSGVGELTTTTAGWYAYQQISTVVGKKYIVECSIISGGATAGVYVKQTSSSSTLASKVGVTSGVVSIEFTATEATTRLWLYLNVIGTATFDNIAVYPSDAISRSDLVFLEQDDYVDVSVNDFVYPLGNKQYLGTTGDCGTTVVGSFAGSSTYSLFSDVWQADGALVGRGYVWSTLSDTNKKLFVSNPENNCYLDGDKVIQVQYRVRVEQGKSDTPLMSQYSFLQDVTKDAGLWYK